MDEATKLVEALTKALGPIGQQVYATYRAQYMIYGELDLQFALGLSVLGVLMLALAVWVRDDMFSDGTPAMVLFAVVGIAMLGIALACYVHGRMFLANPDYYAIRALLRGVG